MDDSLSLAKIRQLAGLDSGVSYNQTSEDRESVFEKRKYELENDIKPGTSEWFDLWFCSGQTVNMPTGFRGRRK